MRLKNVRKHRGISLHKFAQEVGENLTLLSRIETGERYPPRKRLKKYAALLSISVKQLEALIAVERRRLNPYVLLPEIPPPDLSHEWIEREALQLLKKYEKAEQRPEVQIPVPIEQLIKASCGLNIRYFAFENEKDLTANRTGLFGGLFPDGFRGKDRLVAVNTGRVHGTTLSEAEKRTTIAHEAGHYVLHWANKKSRQLLFQFTSGPTFCREAECDQSPFNALEYQASALGACLLMPRNHFLKEWQKTSGGQSHLANRFQVTPSLVRLRATMLGLTIKM